MKQDKAAWFREHALSVGELSGNLLQIELGARHVVAWNDPTAGKIKFDITKAKENTFVEVDPITNYDSLKATLKKYNRVVQGIGKTHCQIPREPLVRLRDSLAHGRMFGDIYATDGHLRLVKFGKPMQRTHTLPVVTVRVELAVVMTDEWFTKNRVLTSEALHKVGEAMGYEQRELGPSR